MREILFKGKTNLMALEIYLNIFMKLNIIRMQGLL